MKLLKFLETYYFFNLKIPEYDEVLEFVTSYHD